MSAAASSNLAGSASRRSGSQNKIPQEKVLFIVTDVTGGVACFEFKANKNISSDQVVKVVRKQNVHSEHEKSYTETHGYMTGKIVSYLQSNGTQKEFWSREISGSGQRVEDPSQKSEGEEVSIVLTVDWHQDCPDEVKGKMAKRRVVSLSDSDDEDLKEKVTIGHMAVRDSKVTDAKEEFGFLRERVNQYVAACNVRSERAQNLIESLSDEKEALVKAFTQGREVKRKYEEVRSYEDEFKLEPQKFVSDWSKEDVMGALADVKGYLEEREDLKETMMLSPLNQ
jgi:hypothetical protein